MIVFYVFAVIFLLYVIVPRSTALHEILRLPGYNLKAQSVRRDDMLIEQYSFGNHRKQYLVLFLPKDGKVIQKEVIIYYHGGGWTFGTPMMFRCNAQFFIDQGYAVIMPSYRRLPFHRAPDMLADAQTALKKSIVILQEKKLGDKKIILSGLSAGGHLAALLAYQKSTWSTNDFSKDKLAGLMLFSAPLDLYKMAISPVIWRLAGRRGSQLFETSNPISFVEKGDTTPLLLVHGTKDGLVNYKSSLSFIEKRGQQFLKFYSIENGTHLNGGNWIFENGELKKTVVTWLRNRDER